MAGKATSNPLRNILITAATGAEVKDLLPGHSSLVQAGTLLTIASLRNARVDLLITGAGIHVTVYHLTKRLTQSKYDLVINLGICGSLHPDLEPVNLVRVVSDAFADLGAEDGASFLDVFELGLEKPNRFPFRKGRLSEVFHGTLRCLDLLAPAPGITVQKTHGSLASVIQIKKRFGPVVESMEGAAFFYVCRMEQTECIQVRSVSNRVERRNRASWKINQAIDALSGFTDLFLLEWISRNAPAKRKKS